MPLVRNKPFKFIALALALSINACTTSSLPRQDYEADTSQQQLTQSKLSTPIPGTQDSQQPPSPIKNILIIVDSSISLKDSYYSTGKHGTGYTIFSKFSLEKQLLKRINTALPNNIINSGLRKFGYGKCSAWQPSRLLQEMQAHSIKTFDSAINQLTCASGGTPAHIALQAAAEDLTQSEGDTAIILLSDGNFTLKTTVQAVRKLKRQYGSQACVYPIWVGNVNDYNGYQNLKKLSASSCCGFMVKADTLQEDHDLQTYLNTISNDFGSPWDGDCDGVVNNLPDQCPETPTNASVNASVNALGCPLDDDRDGIYNLHDHCSKTPFSAHIDKLGCWHIEPILFDTNKSIIKPHNFASMNKIIRIMKKKPNLSLQINAHTDNIATFAYNIGLSKRRATAVKYYFTQHGLAHARIKTHSYSASKPVKPNTSVEGRSQNRRVELSIFGQ